MKHMRHVPLASSSTVRFRPRHASLRRSATLLAFVVFMMPTLWFSCSMAVDLSSIMAASRQTSEMAEAAALAGATVVDPNNGYNIWDGPAQLQVAVFVAQDWRFRYGDDINGACTRSICYDGMSASVTPATVSGNQVTSPSTIKVNIRYHVKGMTFLGLTSYDASRNNISGTSAEVAFLCVPGQTGGLTYQNVCAKPRTDASIITTTTAPPSTLPATTTTRPTSTSTSTTIPTPPSITNLVLDYPTSRRVTFSYDARSMSALTCTFAYTGPITQSSTNTCGSDGPVTGAISSQNPLPADSLLTLTITAKDAGGHQVLVASQSSPVPPFLKDAANNELKVTCAMRPDPVPGSTTTSMLAPTAYQTPNGSVVNGTPINFNPNSLETCTPPAEVPTTTR